MQWFQRSNVRSSGGLWVRQVEHVVLRFVSLAFSLGSASAIRWFFSPLDGVDRLEAVITWVIAVGFGVLGYFVSRGLAHRIMNHEKIWAYVPICLVVEFVEMFCNYAQAAAVIANATWLQTVPIGQRSILTSLTYVALSIIPLVSVLLAVVDVDLDRSKQAKGVVNPSARPKWGNGQAMPTYQSGNGQAMPAYQGGYKAPVGPQGASKPQGGTSAAGVPFGTMAQVP